MKTQQALVEKLRGTSHTSVFYKSAEERLELLAEYFADGLERGELCVWVTRTPADEALTDLESHGHGFKTHIELGSFFIYNSLDTYAPYGHFQLSEMMENLSKFVISGETEGFTGLRTAGEMDWLTSLPHEEGSAIEYENEVNVFMEHNGFTGICLYPVDSMSKQSLQGSLRTHPQFIYDDELYINAYYAPPAQFESAIRSDLLTVTTPFLTHDQAHLFGENLGDNSRKPLDKVVHELLVN